MTRPFSDVVLVPLGDTPSAPVLDVVEDLSRISGLRSRVSETRLPVPLDAYDVGRGQFQAPRVLQRLRAARRGAGEDTLFLGLANVDLFAPGLSFVFGQADTFGGVGVVSLTRLYPAFYGRAHDLATFRRRAAIEAVHEVGHLLGVPHCEDRRCVMFFSSTIADSDRKGPLFCSGCRGDADRVVRRVEAGPWPAPG